MVSKIMKIAYQAGQKRPERIAWNGEWAKGENGTVHAAWPLQAWKSGGNCARREMAGGMGQQRRAGRKWNGIARLKKERYLRIDAARCGRWVVDGGENICLLKEK